MSIVIKSDEINVLIYKYLQECNLAHTAYALFTEANLEQSLTQFKFDIKSGQLISLMEKALIFSQIESHITINDYEECKEPFYLLKPHVCKITQKVKEQKETLLEELNEKIFTTMRRTSSVHNTLQPNRDFEQIIYDQRSGNFLDKFPLKIGDADSVSIKMSKGSQNENDLFCAFDNETQTMTQLVRKDNFLQAVSILPCRDQVKQFEVKDDLLIQIYKDNLCEVVQLSKKGEVCESLCFKLPFLNQCTSIKANKKLKNLIAFGNQDQFCIINTNTKKVLAHKEGIMEWVGYFEYLLLDPKNRVLSKYSLKPDVPIQQFLYQMSAESCELSISLSEIYFSIFSPEENQVLIYNFDQAQPLYIFDFRSPDMNGGLESGDEAEMPEKLKQTLWITVKSTDYFILLTDLSIKTFQIELNNFSKIIEISQYDTEIKKVGRLRKTDQNMYLIGLGDQNLMFYDVELGKIERIQYVEDNQPKQIFELDEFYLLGVEVENKLVLLENNREIKNLFS